MLNKSRTSFKAKNSINLNFNYIKNLYSRDLGILSTDSFIVRSNSYFLDKIKLNEQRSIESQAHSITWFGLDHVENKYLLASRSDGNFICVDLFDQSKKNLKIIFDSSKKRNCGHLHTISCIEWYPIDSGMFFTSSFDQKLRVWDTNSLQCVDEFFLKQKIYSFNLSESMSTSAKTLICLALDNGQVRLVDINSGSFTHTIKAHANGSCVCVKWSPNDTNVVCSAGSDGRVLLWDIRSSKSFLTSLDSEKTINCKNLSKQLLSSKSTAHSGAILGLTYSADGNYLISLGKDNQLRLWNSSNGLNTLVNYGKIPLNTNQVADTCIQLSTTDKCEPNKIYVPSESNLLIFNQLDGTHVNTLKSHFDSINCVLYNQLLKEIYTGSKDRNILIWNKNINQENKLNLHTKRAKSLSSVLLNKDNWSDEES